jgi:hypothetical protein
MRRLSPAGDVRFVAITGRPTYWLTGRDEDAADSRSR